MNHAAGRAVGNSIDTKARIELLRNEAHDGARPVCGPLAGAVGTHARSPLRAIHPLAAKSRLQEALDSGAALECFRQNVAAQGGDERVCDDPGGFLPLVSQSIKVESPRSGFITEIETTEIGHAIAALGGGRVRIEDKIDPAVGFVADKSIGDKLEAGEPIGAVYSGDERRGRAAVERIRAAYRIDEEFRGQRPELIKEVINNEVPDLLFGWFAASCRSCLRL